MLGSFSSIKHKPLWTKYLRQWHQGCLWTLIRLTRRVFISSGGSQRDLYLRRQTMTRQTNILLIDNDLRVREALGNALALENYCVVGAENQENALLEFKRKRTDQPIDVVLIDLNPPYESAWETLQCLAALRPGLPVIGMTGRLEEEER